MVILCDTSVLVAGLVEAHPQYASSFRLMQGVRKGRWKGCVAAHCVAEFYSVMSTLPHDPPILPHAVGEMIELDLRKRFELVEPSLEDYVAAVRNVRDRNLRGGVIFDALVLQAALKKKTSHLITWNLRHFERLSNGQIEIKTPESFV